MDPVFARPPPPAAVLFRRTLWMRYAVPSLKKPPPWPLVVLPSSTRSVPMKVPALWMPPPPSPLVSLPRRTVTPSISPVSALSKTPTRRLPSTMVVAEPAPVMVIGAVMDRRFEMLRTYVPAGRVLALASATSALAASIAARSEQSPVWQAPPSAAVLRGPGYADAQP